MGPAAPGTSVRFRVLIDGQPPGAAHGIDVDEQGNGTVTEQRLYQLIRQPSPSPIASLKSSFSVRAWRLLRSRSADPLHNDRARRLPMEDKIMERHQPRSTPLFVAPPP